MDCGVRAQPARSGRYGCGIHHGFRLSVFAEWLDNDGDGETEEGKVFGYVQSSTRYALQTADDIELQYYGITEQAEQPDGSMKTKQTGQMFLYLVFKNTYGWKMGVCAGTGGGGQIKVAHSFLSEFKAFYPGLEDPERESHMQISGKYKQAKMIDESRIKDMYSKEEVSGAA